MRYEALSKRHPSVDPTLLARYEALYRGGPTFRKSLQKFLPQNPLEGGDMYALRCAEAYYRSYVGPIIDFFAAQLFVAAFTVRTSAGSATGVGEAAVVDPYYAHLKEDCDGVGTDLAALMKAQLVASLIGGWSWVLAEMPSDDGQPAADRMDWDRRGLGAAQLRPLGAADVIDWEVGKDGLLLWAITYACSHARTDPSQPRSLKTETWRLYDQAKVETFEFTYDPKKTKLKPETEIPSIGVEAHRFPRVPLVQVRLPDGLWLMARCADAQIEHFRLSSALSWGTKRACYPMVIFKAAAGASIPEAGAGFIQKIGIEESFEWVAPTTAPLEHLADQITAQKGEIYRIGQQMAHSTDNTSTALGRSGESKAADAAATEICLHAYADVVKDAVEELFELVSDARGETALRFSIEGMDSFSLSDITVALANLERAFKLDIPSPTLIRELQTRAADLLLPEAAQDVKDQIRAELAELPASTKSEVPVHVGDQKIPPAPPGAG